AGYGRQAVHAATPRRVARRQATRIGGGRRRGPVRVRPDRPGGASRRLARPLHRVQRDRPARPRSPRPPARAHRGRDVGAALAALAIVAPWLVWLPALQAPAPTVFAGALAIGCALHGWGRLVARLAGRDDVEPALALQWGVAAVLAIAGI